MPASIDAWNRQNLAVLDMSAAVSGAAATGESLEGASQAAKGELGRRSEDVSESEGAPEPSRRSDASRAAGRLLDTVLKSATIGLCLRGGLHAVSVLLSQLSKQKRRAKRSGEHLEALALDTLKFMAFLAAFGGTYVTVDEGLCYCLGRERTKRWRAAVAGGCAAPTVLLVGPGSYSGLASYIFLRGVLLLIRCGNKPDAQRWVRAVLAPSRWENSDTMLMCIASSQILTSWIVMPTTLPPSYVKFLNAHGGKKLWVYGALREWALQDGGADGPLMSLEGRAHHAVCHAARPCEFTHPGASCSKHIFAQLPANFRRALAVYIPVYVIPALLVHRKNILHQPLEISSKVVKGVLRSSAFLAVYVALAWAGACVTHRGRASVPQRMLSSTSMYALTVWISGLATLIEKKSRRLELAMYVMSRALVSFGQMLVERGFLPQRLEKLRADVLFLALGLAAITHCYSDGDGCHRDVFKSKYLSVLDFVFGNAGFSKGSIRHVPSSNQVIHLLLHAGIRNRAAGCIRRTQSADAIASRLPSLDLPDDGVTRDMTKQPRRPAPFMSSFRPRRLSFNFSEQLNGDGS